MAFDRSVRYPTKWLPATDSFPLGVPKNSTTEISKDGSPFEKDFISDTEGFFQGLIKQSGLIISGNPDTALVSDYINALKTLVPAPIGSVNNFKNLVGLYEGQQISLTSYHPGWAATASGMAKGGGIFAWDPAMVRTTHDGGTRHSPSRDLATEGLTTYLSNVVNIATGGWKRIENEIDVYMFGAIGTGIGTGSDTVPINSALAAKSLQGGGDVLLKRGEFNANVFHNFAKVNLIGEYKGSLLAPSTGICLICQSVSGGNAGLVNNIAFSGKNGATVGLSINGWSRGQFGTLTFIDSLADGILIDGDGSTEFFFRDVYMNGITRNPLKYSRTDGIDTGGVYFQTLSITGCPSTNPHIELISSHSSRTRAFMFIDHLISDNAPNGCLRLVNIDQFNVDTGWLTGTFASGGLLEMLEVKDVNFDNVSIQNSDPTGYNILLTSGTFTDITMRQMRLSGPGEDLHVVSATISRCELQANSTTATKTNSDSSYRKFVSKGSAKVYQAAVQTITASVFTTVDVDSVVYDDESLINLSSNKYTAVHNGLYSINALVTYLASSDEDRYSIKLLKNGVTTITLEHEEGSGTGNQSVSCSGVFYLVEGDTIEMQTFQDSLSDKSLVSGEEHTRLDITMVRQQ